MGEDVGASGSTARARVLVVDDDARLCAAAERALRHLGYETLVATGGDAGLQLALTHRPDVILVDVRMPGVDGHTLLRRLRSQGVECGVVVMSGHATVDDAIDAIRNGAVDFLKKPWTMPELAAAMARGVERSALLDRIANLPPAESPRAREVVAAAPAAPAPAPDDSIPHPTPAGAVPVVRPRGDGAIFRGVVAQVREGEAHLPPLPAVLGELRKLVYSSEASVGRVSALIERDQALTAELLRITSSAAFAVRQPAARGSPGVRSAVVRVGLKQIQSLVETLVVRRMFTIQSSRLRPMASRVWRASIARAMSMRALGALAATAGVPVEPETAYLAGLLADSGASYLLWFADDRASQGAAVDAPTSLEAIHRLHVEVGVEVLTKYDVDPTILEVARSHHRRVTPVPTSPYWHLATVSSGLIAKLVPGGDVTVFEHLPAEVVAASAAELRIEPTALTELMLTLPDDLKAFFASLG